MEMRIRFRGSMAALADAPIADPKQVDLDHATFFEAMG
jgi:hypothetical protein